MADSQRERERLGVKYADAKRARDELHVQVGKVRDEARAAHDGRLAEELERLTQRSRVELDEIRGKQREAFEREIAGLREAREIAQVRLCVCVRKCPMFMSLVSHVVGLLLAERVCSISMS